MLKTRGNLCFELAEQIIALKQCPVLACVLRALDFILGLGMSRCAAHIAHVPTTEPKGQFLPYPVDPIV